MERRRPYKDEEEKKERKNPRGVRKARLQQKAMYNWQHLRSENWNQIQHEMQLIKDTLMPPPPWHNGWVFEKRKR